MAESGNVIDFKTRDGVVGDGFVVPPDQILEANKGRFKRLVLVGEDENGKLVVASSHGEPEAFLALHLACDYILNNFRPG